MTFTILIIRKGFGSSLPFLPFCTAKNFRVIQMVIFLFIDMETIAMIFISMSVLCANEK